MSAFPPIRSLQSIPISTTEALHRLQSYLEATESNPALLPNATLQVDGPKAQSESASNLVIHNLKRVEAGLRGEWLAPTLELEADGMGGLDAFPVIGNGEVGEEDAAGEEGWQDLEEYQREQSIEAGELGPRQTGIWQQGEETMTTNPLVTEGKTPVDKVSRKRDKKERLKQLKVARKQADQSK